MVRVRVLSDAISSESETYPACSFSRADGIASNHCTLESARGGCKIMCGGVEAAMSEQTEPKPHGAYVPSKQFQRSRCHRQISLHSVGGGTHQHIKAVRWTASQASIRALTRHARPATQAASPCIVAYCKRRRQRCGWFISVAASRQQGVNLHRMRCFQCRWRPR